MKVAMRHAMKIGQEDDTAVIEMTAAKLNAVLLRILRRTLGDFMPQLGRILAHVASDDCTDDGLRPSTDPAAGTSLVANQFPALRRCFRSRAHRGFQLASDRRSFREVESGGFQYNAAPHLERRAQQKQSRFCPYFASRLSNMNTNPAAAVFCAATGVLLPLMNVG